MHKAFCGRLEANILTDGYTLERQLAEGDIDFERVSGLR